MKLHLDKGQRLFLLGSALLLTFLFLRPVYVPLERQIARTQQWPEEQISIFYHLEAEDRQLLCFQLVGSDVLGYAVATTGKYPEIERMRTTLDKIVSRGESIWMEDILPLSVSPDGDSCWLFLACNKNLSEIQHTVRDTTVSYPVTSVPSAIVIPRGSGLHTIRFLDYNGNELD